MELVYVPGGIFQRSSTYGGDRQLVHDVTLDSFWIDRTEVTNGQYARCVAAGVCSPPYQSSSARRESYYGDSQYDDYPVIWVSWNDAATYCGWVGGRLSSEAEWEYAARGPDGRIYPWGNDPPNDTLLNYEQFQGDTVPVGSYPDGASWVGAMDMAGNVWEWVNDWFASDYYASSPSHNPQGPETGDEKVLRGGSWYPTGVHVRATDRLPRTPDVRSINIGFRCVVELGN